MSIVISDKTKNRILQFIDDNALESSFSSSFIEKALQDLENNNELNEYVARKVLEEIYEIGRTVRDVVTPDKEFEARFEEAFMAYDKLTKPDDYGTFENNDLSEEQIVQSIESCFDLTELYDEFDTARDTRKMAQEAISSIEFLKKNGIEVSPETRAKLEEVTSRLQGLLTQETTNVASLQEEIECYNDSAMEVWESFLSDPSREGGDENYVIHNFTSGKVKGEFRDKYMSTSLITKNARGIYGSSGFGYIVKPKHIVAADSKDTYTINNSHNDSRVTIIKHPIKLPQQIEAEMMETCKSVNGEILNSDKASIYSEVVVDEYEIEGIFLMTNGEKELNPHYREAVELAKEKGVPFRNIDIAKDREEQGLDPLSPEMKKGLCRRVLFTYCKNEQYGVQEDNYAKFASEFIENNYEEFAERFLAVKGQEGYTAEDIEKSFRTMILDNAVKSKDGIHIFDKESILHYQGYFLGKVTEGEFKYIVSSRYDLSKCESLEEFKERYAEFKDRVVQSKYFDESQEYLDEMFAGNEVLIGKNLSDEELEQIFNSEDRSLRGVVSYVQDRNKEQIEASVPEEIIEDDEPIVPVVEETEVETPIEDNGVYINELGKIIKQNNTQKFVPPETENIEVGEAHINDFREIIRPDNVQGGVTEVVTQENNSTTQLTFMQRVAQRVSSNRFLSKLPFMKKFAEKQLKMLSEAKQEFKTVDTVDNKTNSFMKSLQDLKKDDKEIASSFEEQDKIKDIQKKIERKENGLQI